jgi:curved DNA-binding protein
MTDGETPFIDHYAVLRVHPACDEKALEAAYHELAKRYHPDNADTGDAEKFNDVIQAYKVLRSTTKRARYDRDYARTMPGGASRFTVPQGEVEVEDQGAIDDAEAHDRILIYLYNKRRENAQDAGVIGFYLQEMLRCTHEHFEFHKWYLKEKGFIHVTEQGTLAITIQGVDQVISMSRTAKAEKLLIAQRDD